jgi:hypothetical protein
VNIIAQQPEERTEMGYGNGLLQKLYKRVGLLVK